MVNESLSFERSSRPFLYLIYLSPFLIPPPKSGHGLGLRGVKAPPGLPRRAGIISNAFPELMRAPDSLRLASIPTLNFVHQMLHTYITTNLRNGTLYTGHTDDRARRTHQHKTGHFPGFSRNHGCKYLVWYEEHETRDAAFIRERRNKEWNRAWKLKLIEKDNPHWLDIMACPVWPLPKGAVFADLRQAAMAHKLDPAPRVSVGNSRGGVSGVYNDISPTTLIPLKSGNQ